MSALRRRNSIDRLIATARKVSDILLHPMSGSSPTRQSSDNKPTETLNSTDLKTADILKDMASQSLIPLSSWTAGEESTIILSVSKDLYSSPAFAFHDRHRDTPKTVPWTHPYSLQSKVLITKLYSPTALSQYASHHELVSLRSLESADDPCSTLYTPSIAAIDIHSPTGSPRWIATAAFNGGDLAMFLRSTPIWPGEATLWHFFIELCKALHYTVVSQGIVSTDLAPCNIMLDTRELREEGLPNLAIVDWSRTVRRKDGDVQEWETAVQRALYWVGNAMHLIAHRLRPVAQKGKDCWFRRDWTGCCWCAVGEQGIPMSKEGRKLYEEVMGATGTEGEGDMEAFFVRFAGRAQRVLREAKAGDELARRGLEGLAEEAGWKGDEWVRRSMKKAAKKFR